MSEFKVSGVVLSIGEEQQVSATFKKRAIRIETDDKYPQIIEIFFVQDKTSLLNTYQVGETVEIKFNIRGNEWKERVFIELTGWFISRAGAAAGQSTKPAVANDFSEEDDLPF